MKQERSVQVEILKRELTVGNIQRTASVQDMVVEAGNMVFLSDVSGLFTIAVKKYNPSMLKHYASVVARLSAMTQAVVCAQTEPSLVEIEFKSGQKFLLEYSLAEKNKLKLEVTKTN